MMKLYQLCISTLLVPTIVIWRPVLCSGANMFTERDAAQYLEELNHLVAKKSNEVIRANWDWSTNLTHENAVKMFQVNAVYSKLLKKLNKETVKYRWTTYKDPSIIRQLKLFSALGADRLPEKKMKKFDNYIQAMNAVHNNVTIPEYRKGYPNRTLSFDFELADISATSTDADELKHLWTQWSDLTGRKIRNVYPEYVKLSNEAVKLNRYANTKDFWTSKFEVKDFPEQMERAWDQVRPLYLQIHAYARKKLWERYGDSVISRRGPIPVHLLNDFLGCSWSRLADLTKPYPDVRDVNLTEALINQKYTPIKIFLVAEEFMTSLNFSSMPQSFWNNSFIEKPKDREILCHATVWDFADTKDFRVIQCTKIDYTNFLNAHKEMAVMHYYVQYKDQPHVFRDGPYEGFQDVIGDTIALSVASTKHLHKLGLIPIKTRTPQSDINFLYTTAMDKIMFLPFVYIMDLWRWNVFDGTTSEIHYNSDWWKLRYDYQGVEPPETRSERDFDPGSKYHIVANVPSIRYFMSFILQFQLHQALCEKAGEFDPKDPNSTPLHECDIYESTKAGNALKEMLNLGASKPWYAVLEVLTGQREMDVRPLLNYFKPLHEWLENENKRTGELIGWESNKTICVREAYPVLGMH